jgi:1-acyl-sn-glycerol-3-phosphate acyltransferase
MNNTKFHEPESTGFIQFLVSVYFWVSLFLIPGILFPFLVLVWFFTVLFDKRLVILHQCTCILSDITFAANPFWKATIEGSEKIDRKGVYVIVSNHQSGADIMILFKTHATFKWVSKKSLFFFPFIGWNMWLNRYIPIERSRGRSRLKMIDKAIKAVKQGNSLMLFPEGTRSRDGLLQSFKPGAFRVALETQTNILPIAIKGTFHAIRKGSLIINKNDHLKAVILDPISYNDFRNLKSNEVAVKVHDLIQAEINRK